MIKPENARKRERPVKLKWEASGSYTVEAAYIMPLLLALIFLIMCYAFFFHGSIISEAWAAHLAEEERMAVSYGKIPFDSVIYLEGFNNEAGFVATKALMSENLESHYRFMIAGKPQKAKLSVSGDEVSAEIRFSMSGFKLHANDTNDYEASFTESRSIFNPQKYARITKGVYRFAKQRIFNLK